MVATPVISVTGLLCTLQFALSVMSSGCYEDDADDGEVMTLTGQPDAPCSMMHHAALLNKALSGGHAGKIATRAARISL